MLYCNGKSALSLNLKDETMKNVKTARLRRIAPIDSILPEK